MRSFRDEKILSLWMAGGMGRAIRVAFGSPNAPLAYITSRPQARGASPFTILRLNDDDAAESFSTGVLSALAILLFDSV